MSVKTKSIGALVVALAIILAINPRMIYNMYSTILGRIIFLGVIIFISMNNTSLGLLVALAVIAATNQFGPLVEGLDNIGEDNSSTTGNQKVLTKSAVEASNSETTDTSDKQKKMSELKQKASELGVDKEDIKNAIASKDSKSMPITPNSSSEDVSAFKESMLTNSSTLTEGFCPFAASVF
jgi:hypothetical protein